MKRHFHPSGPRGTWISTLRNGLCFQFWTEPVALYDGFGRNCVTGPHITDLQSYLEQRWGSRGYWSKEMSPIVQSNPETPRLQSVKNARAQSSVATLMNTMEEHWGGNVQGNASRRLEVVPRQNREVRRGRSFEK